MKCRGRSHKHFCLLCFLSLLLLLFVFPAGAQHANGRGAMSARVCRRRFGGCRPGELSRSVCR